MNTPIYRLNNNDNNIYIKRDDLFPYSFGGNKARKGLLFFEDIKRKQCDCVVTYGSSSSNHVRIITNKCSELNIPCFVISPEEKAKTTFNSVMYNIFGAKIITTPINEVSNTIEKTLIKLKEKGFRPYFIQGGGHGNIGTQAYVDCYDEILQYEKEQSLKFDYIFHASGTGTTQAGLVCGSILNKDDTKIVGISIARQESRGKKVVLNSITDYLDEKNIYYIKSDIEDKTIFLDNYVLSGYGSYDKRIVNTIIYAMKNYGIPMDTTYVGKAFYGMTECIKENKIKGKNILFIHTGGTPLFFDDLEVINDKYTNN